jgi:plastocyanin
VSDEAPRERRHHPALPPVAYPLLALVFGSLLVWSFSRVLLAVSKRAAPAIGLLLALNVLIGAALIAYGGRVRRRPASFPLLMVGGIAILGIGVVAMGMETHPAEEGTEKPGAAAAVTVKLVAKDIKFDKQELSFPAGSKVKLDFTNDDSGIPHNVAIFSEQNPTNEVFKGDIFPGVATKTYTFTAPGQPGTYAFHCEVHPAQMKGTVEVTAPGEGGGGAGGGGSGPVIVAKSLAFNPTEVTVSGGGQVTITFDNQDAGIPHNIHVFKGKDATAPSLFAGPLITGPAKQDYSFAAPPPGSYFFHCDVHPAQMMGTLTVT